VQVRGDPLPCPPLPRMKPQGEAVYGSELI